MTSGNPRPWLPDEPPIEDKCDGCKRGIPQFLYEGGYAVSAYTFDLYRDENLRSWELCGTCGDEFRSFAEDILDLDLNESADCCGFCGENLGERRWEIAFSPTCRDEWVGAPVCGNCKEVTETFVDNLPEAEPDGPDPSNDVYYPAELSEDPVSIDAASVDGAAINSAIGEINSGESVHFEAHNPVTEGRAAEYIVGLGEFECEDRGPLVGAEYPIDNLQDVEGVWLTHCEITHCKIRAHLGHEGPPSFSLQAYGPDGHGGEEVVFSGDVTALRPTSPN